MSITKSWQDAIKNFNGDLENFLRWSECQKRFVVVNNPAIKIEFDSLDLGYWKNFLKDSKTGNPTPANFYPESSENTIHYAYHVDIFQKRFNKKITDYDSIIEFGGGYGGMCNLIRKMGFKGKYIIYDLPEVSEIQKYYLTKENCMENTIITNDFSIFDNVHDLLIATWSLSETPLDMRLNIIKSAENFLMAFQPNFEGIDNMKYFEGTDLEVFPIEHLSNQYYCMGVNR